MSAIGEIAQAGNQFLQFAADLGFGIADRVYRKKAEWRNYRRFLENRAYETAMGQFADRVNYNRFLENREYESEGAQFARLKALGISEHSIAGMLTGGNAGAVPVSSPPDSGQPPMADSSAMGNPVNIQGVVQNALTIKQMAIKNKYMETQQKMLESNLDKMERLKEIDIRLRQGELTQQDADIERQRIIDQMTYTLPDGSQVPAVLLPYMNQGADLTGKNIENRFNTDTYEKRVEHFNNQVEEFKRSMSRHIEEHNMNQNIARKKISIMDEELNKLKLYNTEQFPLIKKLLEAQEKGLNSKREIDDFYRKEIQPIEKKLKETEAGTQVLNSIAKILGLLL